MKEYQLEEIGYQHNLLVIDDEVEITKTLFRQFRRKYNVFVANSAESALPIMEEKNIQVVLSDQRMPGMTGVDFFSKIKDRYPDALRLLITGYSDIEAVVGAINEGQVFRYVTKPWNPKELNSVIEEAFDKYELITNNRLLLKKLKEAKQSLEKKVNERTQELERANANLTQLNIEKNKYIGMVSHDLRSPIGAALSFSDLLIEDYTNFTQKEHIKFLKIINKRCSFALNLIGDFLDASKIESGILDLDFTENDYCELVQSCISQNSIYAQKKSQQIIFNSVQPEIKISLDRSKIEQVFNNLLMNAIKYSHKNKKIWVNIHIENNNIITEVKDEGQGIPENELDSVFVAYKTTSVKPTNNEKSTGLGLTIAKKIIIAHRGEIFVKSKEGIGSTFYFTLPYKTEPKKENMNLKPVSLDKTIRKLKILIAEDDETSEMLIDNYIKNFGKEILKVRTGADAVDACRNNPDIDLVLMDIRMPKINGYDATKQIRKFNKEVIIIAQTAYGIKSDRGKALEAGCNDYIAKPIKKTELHVMIQKYFGQ